MSYPPIDDVSAICCIAGSAHRGGQTPRQSRPRRGWGRGGIGASEQSRGGGTRGSRGDDR